MKKYGVAFLTLICLVCFVTLFLSSCQPATPTEHTVTFVADGQAYATVMTAGNEVITMPTNPLKDGYTFDGWYVDEGVWKNPFTSDSFAYSALTADVTVYAKFLKANAPIDPEPKPEPPVLTYEWQVTTDATCTTAGIEERINPETNQKESREIIPLGHVYGEFVITRKPSCSLEGSKGKTCFRCRDVVTESIPMVEHTPSNWIITEQPTCSTLGKQIKQCDDCKIELDSKSITSNHKFGVDDLCVYCGCSNLNYYYDYYKNYCVWGFANADIEHSTLIIPKYNDGIAVTKISNDAFKDDKNLTSVTIPDSVINISKNSEYTHSAFYGCISLANINYLGTINSWCQIEGLDNLMEYGTDNKTLVIDGKEITGDLVIPNTVTSISSYAFYKTNLTSVIIPNSVTKIGSCSFHNCDALTIYCEVASKPNDWWEGKYNNWNGYCPVVWDCNNNKADKDGYMYAVIDGIRYSLKDNMATVEKQPISNVTVVNIPSSVTYEGVNYSVTRIVRSAFSSYNELETLTLPFVGAKLNGTENTHFGYIFGASSGCCTRKGSTGELNKDGNMYYVPSSLKTVVIVGGSNFGEDAFYDCGSLVNITISDSITSIGEHAFYNCSALTSINYLGIIEDWCQINGLYGLMNYGVYNKKLIIDGKEITGDLVIPDTVTSISSFAFYGTGITSVTFEENSQCTSIGNHAFSGCSGLTSITIPNSVTSIENSAFRQCMNLTSVTIGNGGTNIGDSAFIYCYRLTSVTIGNSVTSIGGPSYDSRAFYCCDSLAIVNYLGTIEDWCQINGLYGLMCYGVYNKKLIIDGKEITGDLVIPDTVTSISSFAFYKTGITSVTFEENSQCTSIGNHAFRGCSGLTSITIPNSVTSIENDTFGGCDALTIYCEVTSKPYGWDKDWNFDGWPVVWDCNNNKADKDGYMYAVIDGIRYALKDNRATVVKQSNSSATTVNIPDSVTYEGIDYSDVSIASAAFSNCNNLTSVTIGNSVTSIGDYAFSACSKLQYNEYDDALYLGNETNPYLALISAKSKNITSCNIHINTKIIADRAFWNCNNLTSITIPDSVTSIGNLAFAKCSNLISVTIPDNVTSIGNYAFSSCSNLTSVTIPDNVTIIGDYAFQDCVGIKNIVIGNNVTIIGDYAFQNCGSITNIIIGNKVARVGYLAFVGCRIEKIYYNGTADDWAKISIGSDTINNPSKRYYYSETEPELNADGNYWHYDENGEISVWDIE